VLLTIPLHRTVMGGFRLRCVVAGQRSTCRKAQVIVSFIHAEDRVFRILFCFRDLACDMDDAAHALAIDAWLKSRLRYVRESLQRNENTVARCEGNVLKSHRRGSLRTTTGIDSRACGSSSRRADEPDLAMWGGARGLLARDSMKRGIFLIDR